MQATALLPNAHYHSQKQDSQYQNLFNVRQLLNQLGGNPEGVDALFMANMPMTFFFAEYKSFIAYDAKVVSSIIATCKAALQIFSDEAAAHRDFF